eukprot:g4047.t1
MSSPHLPCIGSPIQTDNADSSLERRITGCLMSAPSATYTSLEEVLSTLKIREIETLNGVSLSGNCQFSSIALQLYGRLCEPQFRPDILLRRLVIRCIRSNPAMYQSFMLPANARTRHQNSVGGSAVNLNKYLRSMRSQSCDGDAITLQALADLTCAKINVVKRMETGHVMVHRVSPRKLDRRPEGHVTAPGRSMWVSLRGEAHYRSLHPCSGDSPRWPNLKLASCTLNESRKEIPTIDLTGDSPPSPRARAVKGTSSSTNSIANKRETLITPVKGKKSEHNTGFSSLCDRSTVSRKLDEEERGEKVDDLCAICLESFADEDRGLLNSCTHVYHASCILQWSSNSNSCPLCTSRFNFLTCVDAKGNLLETKAVKEVDLRALNALEDENGNIPAHIIREQNSICQFCGIDGDYENLLLCDGFCGTSAHVRCLGLQSVPDEEWFCAPCRTKLTAEGMGVTVAQLDTILHGESSRRRRSLRRSSNRQGYRNWGPLKLLNREVKEEEHDIGRVTNINITSEIGERNTSTCGVTSATGSMATAAPRVAPLVESVGRQTHNPGQNIRQKQLGAVRKNDGLHYKPSSRRRTVMLKEDSNNSVVEQAWQDLELARTIRQCGDRKVRRSKRIAPPVSMSSSVSHRAERTQKRPKLRRCTSSKKSTKKTPSFTEVQNFIEKINVAADNDAAAQKRGWPAECKVKLINELCFRLHDVKTQKWYLDAGLLKAFNRWLEHPLVEELPQHHLRSTLLDLCLSLPVRIEHIRSSGGLGRRFCALLSQQEETRENKMKIMALIERWSQLVLLNGLSSRDLLPSK